MYKLKLTSAYKKGYKRMKKRGMDVSLLDDVVVELLNGKKLDEKYYNHELKGEFAGFYECHIKPDWLLVYLIEDDVLTLTLVNTGKHTEIFRE